MDKNIFPGWEIMEELGAGAFSTVYKIRKADGFGADYFSALKVISIPNSKDEYNQYRDEGYTEEEISKLFEQQTQSVTNEFKVLSAFKGAPNIVSFDDYRVQQKENGIGWDVLIRMELLTALPNAYKSSPLTVEDTVKLGTDICNALILCEQKNIIHRDIKPQNIFVSEFGDYKLGDFGIARNMDHTTRATKIGTPAYMAPEVFHGNAYNNTADIYSLGMVLYWLLNERRMPFLPLPPQMPTAEQTSNAHTKRLSGAPLPPPKNGTDALKQAVLKACAFAPAERYATAKEFKAALAASLAAPVVHTAPTAPIVQDIEATVAVRKAPKAQKQSNNKQQIDSQQQGSNKQKATQQATSNKRQGNGQQSHTKQQSSNKQQSKKQPKAVPLWSAQQAQHPQRPPEEKKSKKWLIILLCLLLVLGVGLGLYFIMYGGKKDADSKTDNHSSAYEVIASNDEADDTVHETTSVAYDETSQTQSKVVEDTTQQVSSETTSVAYDETSQTQSEVVEDTTAPPSVEITSIALKTKPTKTSYYKGDTLNTSGLVLTVNYNNGTSKTVTSGFSCTPTVLDTVGASRTITVSYGGKTTSFTVNVEGIEWTLSDGTLTISGNGPMATYSSTKDWLAHKKEIKKVVIKSGVTSIGADAFRDCDALTSITIPDSVTSIGAWAFYSCTSLTSITIGDGVISIGNGAFWSCNSLTAITIPDSVTSIGGSAFTGCDSLTSVTIPNSVTSIGDGAFYSCDSLTSISIPDSVKSIGNLTFARCASLTSISIPDSVTSIGDDAFRGCDSLTSVNYKGTKAQWAKVSLGSDWKYKAPFTVVHCTDGDVAVS